jgi:metaxin
VTREKKLKKKTKQIFMATTTLAVPQTLVKLFAYFPFKTYPPSKPEKVPIVSPILWIHPPLSSVLGQESTLSTDIECLKWQAHIALRGFCDFSVRWDISQDGALDGRLPNLQIPSGDADSTLLAAHNIPTWIDENVGALDELEGYKDVESRDESHAWIALLEGDIHAALVGLFKLIFAHFIYNLQLGIGPTSTFFLLS